MLDIKGLIETSLVDWDGKIVCVIFLPGCNFRCPYCQNSGLIDHPDKYKTVSEQRVLDYLESHRAFVDGICITGGEPTLQKDNGLTEFIKKVKDMGALVKLDTNGSDPDYIKLLESKKLVDFIAMDLKAPLHQYSDAARVKVDTDKISQSIRYLIDGPLDHEFRTTVAPGIVGVDEIEKMALTIKGAKKYVIQQFEPDHCDDPEMKKVKPYDDETIAKMIAAAKKHLSNVKYRGKQDIRT